MKVFTRAIKLLEDSERIYILGFGFHSISLKRLRISELKNKLIAGTAFKMGKMEVNRVATQLDMNLLNERLHNCNIIEFFREHCSLS